MTRRTSLGLWSGFGVLVVAVIAWAVVAQGQRGGAQQPPPVRQAVQVTHVKPDMVNAYQDLLKNELIPNLKKAGIAYRWTWRNGPFGDNYTFVSEQPITSYAQYDQPGALQRAIGAEGVAKFDAKLWPMIVSQHTYAQTLRQDLSIPSASGQPPALLAVQIFQIGPGKGNDFTSIMTSDYLPNFKKAGLKDFRVYAMNFGAAAGQLVTLRGISKFAELDEPGLLNKAGLTTEQAQQVNGRRAAIASVIENDVVRLVPELSFGSMSSSRPPSAN
jgi:hypothetical protein